jgi:hypothetical protein
MVLSLNGEPQHSENEDPERRIFEMSKSDFAEENICEFCCKGFSSLHDFNQHIEQQVKSPGKLPSWQILS